MKQTFRVIATLGCLAISLPAAAATATATRAWQFKAESAAGLEVRNLIGDVRIERGTGAGFHITVRANVETASQAEADRLLGLIEYRTRDSGSDSRFDVALPREHFPKLWHPDGAKGWLSSAHVEHLGERIGLTGDRGEAPAVRVDLVIRAPAGAKLGVDIAFGDMTAVDYSGELRLDGSSGTMRSSGGDGRLVFDSGSGSVEVQGHRGRVIADTGSGEVTIVDCACEIDADTGSGDVEIRGGSGAFQADTGSGEVKVEGFTGTIGADTGSGSVVARRVADVKEFAVDTGSGDVTAEGDLSALRRLHIDTGSGSVRLHSSAAPSIEIRIDTGSGGVDVDAPGATVRESDNGIWTVRFGAGEGSGVIDTGSGSVDIVVPQT